MMARDKSAFQIGDHVYFVKVQIKMPLLGYDNNPNDPMLLFLDNSDSPSIVEQ